MVCNLFGETKLPDKATSVHQRHLSATEREVPTLQEDVNCSIINSDNAKPWLDQERFLSIRVGGNKDEITPKEPKVLLLSEICL